MHVRDKVLALHMVIWACSPEPHMALNADLAPNQNNPKAQLPTQLGPLLRAGHQRFPSLPQESLEGASRWFRGLAVTILSTRESEKQIRKTRGKATSPDMVWVTLSMGQRCRQRTCCKVEPVATLPSCFLSSSSSCIEILEAMAGAPKPGMLLVVAAAANSALSLAFCWRYCNV